MKSFERKVISIDIGDIVLCDLCNIDYTNSKVYGGIVLGSYAICPECLKPMKLEPEDNINRCPKGMTFANFIRSIR